MIPTILGSLILMKKTRRMTEVFSPPLMKLWKEWELRAMVLASLLVQILLILLGNRRKSTSKIKVRAVVWCSYLLADSVATIALGILTNDLGDIYDKGGAPDLNTELKAMWAPFLLLHLGGPDTVTAYSLEDNQLWLRHFFGLIVQTTVTGYIFLMAWTDSRLSKLTIPMIVVGAIKYAERTWTLWRASTGELRDSMLTSPDPGPNYPKLMDEYSLRKFEGFLVDIAEVEENEEDVDITASEKATSDEHNIIKANVMFQIFKRLFVDLILSFKDREKSQKLFQHMKAKEAFNVVAIELGFMYDLLYTKATVVYTRFGFACRFTTVSLVCLVLVLFSSDNLHKYEKVDVSITLLLLSVAILLEIYAALVLLSSDQANHWLIKHKKTSISKATKCLRLLFKLKRWSGHMAQYSLLSVCLKEKPGFKLFEKLLEKYPPRSHKKVEELLTDPIFHHVKMKFEHSKEKVGDDTNLRDLCRQRGKSILEIYEQRLQTPLNLEWSINVEFDQSILIWHIATEICYSLDDQNDIKQSCEVSQLISKYLIYLLVIHPLMLPIGIGLIRFRDTEAEARRFFQERLPSPGTEQMNKITKYCRKLCQAWRFFKELLCASCTYKIMKENEACKLLLQVNTEVEPSKVKGDRSKSVLFDACRLASILKRIPDKKVKWEMISDIWLEMLTYAASQCRGSQHAEQLRRGGELLTHVWLLMAHFGITEQLQISKGHARALLIAN